MPTCRCQYPGGIVGSDRSWDGLFHPFPRSPTTAAFPVMLAGRLPRHHFRGLLSIHSRYGLPTRCTAERYMCLEGSDGFVTSAAAPIASGRSDRVGRAGLAPAGTTLPLHGAQHNGHYQTALSQPKNRGFGISDLGCHVDELPTRLHTVRRIASKNPRQILVLPHFR